MTVERGDSPLAGRHPAPLSSASAMGPVKSHNPLSARSKLGAPPGSPANPPNASLNAHSAFLSLQSQANPTPSVSASPTTVGCASSGVSSGVGDHRRDSRLEASFWLELKGVERWFEQLDPPERITLMATLFARSSEHQLYQFSSSIDKAVRNTQSTTAKPSLNRFTAPSSDLYRYRPSLNGQTSLGAGTKTTGFSSQLASLSTPSQLGSSQLGANSPLSASTPMNAKSLNSAPPQLNTSQLNTSQLNTNSLSALSTRARDSSSQPPSSAKNDVRGTQSATSSTNGHFLPLSFGPSSAGHAADLYTQAFLPLPRAQSFSPWGAKIHRPSSAAADAWPEKVGQRVSPVLKAQSSGSPNVSSLSLDAKPSSSASTSAPPSAQTNPVAGPALPPSPWRTFVPQPTPTDRPSSPPSPRLSRVGQVPDLAETNSPSNHLNAGSDPSLDPSLGSSSAPSSVANLGLSLGANSVPNSATNSLASSPPTYALLNDSSSSASPPSSPEKTRESLREGKEYANVKDPVHLGRLARRGTVNVVDVSLLSDIGAWLRSLRLHKYTDNLRGMRWQDVIHLSDQDLEFRGINALGARRKLLKIFEEIREAQEAGLISE